MPLSQQVSISVANETVGLSVKIINIPEDTLRLTLKEQTEKIKNTSNIGDIIGAAGLFITSVAALVSGYSEKPILAPALLDFIFGLGLIGSIIDLFHSILCYRTKEVTIDDIITEIYHKISPCDYREARTTRPLNVDRQPVAVITNAKRRKKRKKRK